MLIEAFVKFAFDILRWLLSLVPDITIPSFDFSAAVGIMQDMNTALPVTEALLIVTAYVSIVGALFALQVARAILRHVPWVGGG